MREFNRVIFVSGHGVCRAPMAAVILKEQPLNREIEIKARGRSVSFPEPVNPKMLAIMAGNGYEMEKYDVAVQLSEEDINDTTIIFTFDSAQKEQLIENISSCTKENTFVLSSYVGEELEIMNPYGGTMQAYGLCYEMMSNTVAKLAKMLNGEENS